ncbi:MAG: SH3 domain-containing protein [Gammaproteobacteria bacterium]|nr:SH3 domain-containing protein [Gammaproteobacteria bacterium]
MRSRRGHFVWGVLFILLGSAGAVAADYGYITDKELRVGVRLEPDSDANTLVVVKTGDRLEILGEKGEYYQIRTEDGKEGWMQQKYLLRELAPRDQLQALQQEVKQRETAWQQQLQQQRKKIEAAVAQKVEEIEQQAATLRQVQQVNLKLEEDLFARDKTIVTLQERLQREESLGGGGLLAKMCQPGYLLLTLTIAILLSYLLGRRSYRRYVSARLGGLDI